MSFSSFGCSVVGRRVAGRWFRVGLLAPVGAGSGGGRQKGRGSRVSGSAALEVPVRWSYTGGLQVRDPCKAAETIDNGDIADREQSSGLRLGDQGGARGRLAHQRESRWTQWSPGSRRRRAR